MGIHEKLFKVRDSIKKEMYSNFVELTDVIHKKCKQHKILPLYRYIDDIATLTLVDVEDLKDSIEFSLPVGIVNLQAAKQQLYYMAFDVDEFKEVITTSQYVDLLEKMKDKNVSEKEVLERYKLSSIADMTEDVYRSCMSVLNKMSAGGNKK